MIRMAKSCHNSMKRTLFLSLLFAAFTLCGYAQKHIVKRPTPVKPAPKPKPSPDRGMAVIRGIEKNMVRVEGGTFTMGTPEGWDVPYDNGKPCHCVTLSSYRISRYEVTLRQWRAVMGANKLQQEEWFVNECPVIYVTWYDC